MTKDEEQQKEKTRVWIRNDKITTSNSMSVEKSY
jgi:hypothetical protein